MLLVIRLKGRSLGSDIYTFVIVLIFWRNLQRTLLQRTLPGHLFRGDLFLDYIVDICLFVILVRGFSRLSMGQSPSILREWELRIQRLIVTNHLILWHDLWGEDVILLVSHWRPPIWSWRLLGGYIGHNGLWSHSELVERVHALRVRTTQNIWVTVEKQLIHENRYTRKVLNPFQEH